MSRTLALGILAVFLHVASLEAQQPFPLGRRAAPGTRLSRLALRRARDGPAGALAGAAAQPAACPDAGDLRERLGLRREAIPRAGTPGRPHRDQRLRGGREGRHRLPDLPVRGADRDRRSAPTSSSAPATSGTGCASCASTGSSRSRGSWWPRTRSSPRRSRSGRCSTWTAVSGAIGWTSPGWMRSTTRSGSTPRSWPPRRCEWASRRCSTTTSGSPTSRRAGSRARSFPAGVRARPSGRA